MQTAAAAYYTQHSTSKIHELMWHEMPEFESETWLHVHDSVYCDCKLQRVDH